MSYIPQVENSPNVSLNPLISTINEEKDKNDSKNIALTALRFKDKTSNSKPDEGILNRIWSWWGKEKGSSNEKEKCNDSDSESEPEEPSSSFQDKDPVELSADFAPQNEDVSLPISNSENQLDETIVKTEKTKQTYFERFKGGLVHTMWNAPGVQAAVNKYIKNYDAFDKDEVIEEQKNMMRNQLQDPWFMEFYMLVTQLLIPTIDNQLAASIDEKNAFLSDILATQRPLILKLIEVILARGFANLAQQVKDNKENIPNYEHQSSLASIISLVCQKSGIHINLKMLADLESKYRQNRINLNNHIQRMSQGLTFEKKQLLDLSIQEYIKSTDLNKKIKIEDELYSNFNGIRNQNMSKEEIEDLINNLEYLEDKDKEIKKLFGQVSDDILACLFPNKLKGIPEIYDKLVPGLLNNVLRYIPKVNASEKLVNFLEDWIYDSIKSVLTTFLQESYESLENDIARNQNWENALKNRLGVHDLQPVINAPSAFLIEFVKNYIQYDHNAINLTDWALTYIKSSGQHNLLSDKDEKQQVLQQEQFANWIIESLQAILNTEDPHLLGLGQFVKQALNNLTLALMNKGAIFALSDEERISSNAFIRKLTDSLLDQFSSLQNGDFLPDQFWKDFVQDLPLPSQIKGLLTSLLINKAKSLQTQLIEKSMEFQSIQHIRIDTQHKIESYEGGKELLSIIKKVSDQIIEQVIEKNIGLMSVLELEDTVDELFAQYLPGIAINEEFKDWFKANISALGSDVAGGSRSIDLIKEGIQAVMQIALVNTIEKNFQNNSKDYAAQLLRNIHRAFMKAFNHLDANHRQKMSTAWEIQAKIQKNNNEIKKLKEGITKKPEGLEAKQDALLKETLNAQIRWIRASNSVDSLENKRVEILAKLKGEMIGEVWVGQGLQFIDQIQRPNPSNSKNNLLLEAADTHVALKHAKEKLAELEEELAAKEQAVKDYRIDDSQQWKEAQNWVEKVLKSKMEINQLSLLNTNLEKKLDSYLGSFQDLAAELIGLLGLDQKEKLALPPFLQDNIWTLIESAKKQHLARLLFAQLSPLLMSVQDIAQNQADFTPSLKQIIKAISIEAVDHIPQFVTSYKPFVREILTVVENGQPTENKVAEVEEALIQHMIELGRKGLAAFMLEPLVKGIVSEEKEGDLSKKIEQLILSEEKKEVSKETLLPLLYEQGRLPTNLKEGEKLEKQAQILAHSINQLLMNLGRAHLKTEDLWNIIYPLPLVNITKEINEYANSTINFIPQFQKEILLQLEFIKEKIKKVIITPEEIARALNNIIPGATDLHSLIAPQIQSVITGDDPIFKENRGELQQLFEGLLLSLFNRIVQANKANQEQNISIVINDKLKKILNNEQNNHKTKQELAFEMSNQILSDILGIKSEEDLNFIPLVLRKIVYEKIQEQTYQQLTPFLLTINERKENRNKLENQSGSAFLGNLCKSLSTDMLGLSPLILNSYQDQITSIISSFIRKPEDQKLLFQQLPNFIQASSDIIKAYIEGVLLKFFTRVAEKNPQQGNKDTVIVLADKLLKAASEAYKKATVENKNIKKVIEEFSDSIMKEVLGIDSANAFDGLPLALREVVYHAIKDQLSNLLLHLQESLSTLDADKSADELTDLNIGINVQIIAEKISKTIMAAVPHTLFQESEGEVKGVKLVSESITNYLQDFVQKDMKTAAELLDYTGKEQFKQILRESFGHLNHQDSLKVGKDKAKHLMSHLLTRILSQSITKMINFEDEFKKEFNQKLMANFLRVGAEHFKNLNQIKKGQSLQDSNELAVASIQKDDVYKRGVQTIMTLLFPNGKNDLTFIPKELRNVVWKTVENQLFPQMIDILVGTILDRTMIEKIALISLDSASKTLEELAASEKVNAEPEYLDQGSKELDNAFGELISEVLQAVNLPAAIKNKLLNEKGEVIDVVKSNVGAILRKQFNDTFIKQVILGTGLEACAQMDLEFDARDPSIKENERIKKAKETHVELKKASRKLVDVSLSYFIKSKWNQAQARFDALIEKTLGKVGIKIKRLLDSVFGFIFFKLIGTFFWPIKQIIKKVIYQVISLDQNRDTLIEMLLARAPTNRFKDNLEFKLGKNLNDVVQEFIRKRSLVLAVQNE